MKKYCFLLILFLLPFNVKAFDVSYDIEFLKIDGDKLYIAGWAFVPGSHFSGGEEINVNKNSEVIDKEDKDVNGVIEIVAVGNNKEEVKEEVYGSREDFNHEGKKYTNYKNWDMLFPSRCERVSYEGQNYNACGQTIYNDSKDALGRSHLTCSGSGTSCLIRNTDFAYVFNLKDLKDVFGDSQVSFKIKITFLKSSLVYGEKFFDIVSNGVKDTKYIDIAVSNSSIVNENYSVVNLDKVEKIVIESDSYSVVVDDVGKYFKTNNGSGRVLTATNGFRYTPSTYWANDTLYEIGGISFYTSTEPRDTAAHIFKGCYYGSEYCNNNINPNTTDDNLKNSYSLKFYELYHSCETCYGNVSNSYDNNNIKNDGYALATWGEVNGGLKLMVNNVYEPSYKGCDINFKPDNNDCENLGISNECVHSVTKSADAKKKEYINLTSNDCKSNHSTKVYHIRDYKFKQDIGIKVFNKWNDDLINKITIERGRSFSIGANYTNNVSYSEVDGTDKYYVEYYIKIGDVCSPRYFEINASDASELDLNIDDSYIKENFFVNDKDITASTNWVDSNDEKIGKTNTTGSSVFLSEKGDGFYTEFNLRNVSLDNNGFVTYCSESSSCIDIKSQYFVPFNYSSNKFDVNISFNNISKLKLMEIGEYDYSCYINVTENKIDTMKYRVIDLNQPFPNVVNLPGNWMLYYDKYKTNSGFLIDRKNLEYVSYLSTSNIEVIRNYNNKIYNNDGSINNSYLYVDKLNINNNGQNEFINDNNFIFDRKVNLNDLKLVGDSGKE